ncbi:MAG: hypothetical protein WA056_08655 [Gallionella sp.]
MQKHNAKLSPLICGKSIGVWCTEFKKAVGFPIAINSMSYFAQLAILLLSFISAALSASAASLSQEEEAKIRFVPGRTPPAGSKGEMRITAVEVNGRIAADSPGKLRAALAQALKSPNAFHHGGAPLVPVHLNSPGGDIVAAMKMGEIIRQTGASTWVVGPRAICASACILVLAGGVDRLLFGDAKLGLHRPYMPAERFAAFSRSEAQASYQAMETAVSEYLRLMGMSQRLFDRMLAVPSNKIDWLSEADAIDLRLLGTDPAFSEWDRARMRQRYVPEFVEWLDKFNDCHATLDECMKRYPPPVTLR